MKYYHLIYNSSQRTQDGSAGLGVRTYTEGMPKEYIDVLDENGYFGYSSGKIPQPSPKTLFEDGKVILQLPATYTFSKYNVSSTGKDIYVIARTVNVGFDYPYYVKFTAARLDNFVLDAYIFEDFPGLEVFEMLYEHPAQGSNRFVPQDRVPSPQNEEMKALSLDAMPLLKPEEKPFACQQLQPVSDFGMEMLFAYFEANRRRLPLLVKCSPEQAPVAMADLMRLLPAEMQKKAFFCTNYQLEGTKEDYKIFFINEGYSFEYEETGQFYIFDATTSNKVATVEAESYRDELATLYREGNTAEYEKRVNWLLNPIYATVRDKGEKTRKVFFDYVIDNSKFNFNDVYNGDAEMLGTLKDYFTKDKANQGLFDNLLERYLKDDRLKNEALTGLLKFVNKLTGLGFDLNAVISNSRKAVSTKLLETPEMFKSAMDAIGLKDLEVFFDKNVLEGHEKVLDDKVFQQDWANLYKYFYPVAKQNDYVGIISRMFENAMPQATVKEVVKGFGANELTMCGYYSEVAKKNPSQAGVVWKYIKETLNALQQRRMPLPDPKLAGEIEHNIIAPLMKSQDCPNDAESGMMLMQLLKGNVKEDNFGVMLKLAQQIDTRQVATILYEKGLGYVKAGQVEPFMKEVLKNAKPEKEEFLVKVEKHPCKLELLETYLKSTGDTKKVIDKMRKDKLLTLTDEEYDKLVTNLFGATPEKSEKKGFLGFFQKGENGEKNKMTLPIIIAACLVLAAVLYFVLSKRPAQKDPNNPKQKVDTVITPKADSTVNDTTPLPNGQPVDTEGDSTTSDGNTGANDGGGANASGPVENNTI